MFSPSYDSSEFIPISGNLNEDSESQKSVELKSFIDFNESKVDNDQFTSKNISELDQIDKPKLSEKPCDEEKIGSTTLSPPKNLEVEKNPKEKKLMGRNKKNPETKEPIKTDNSNAHDRNSEDNKMRKLKTNIMEDILNELNESLDDKTLKFKRLHPGISENLNKNFNEALMDTTINELFSNVSISKKYGTGIDPKSNQMLIDKIVDEEKETKTLKILNMTYYEVIKKIRRKKNMKAFLAKIKNKEIKMKNIDNIEGYMNSLKKLLIKFKKWFVDKKSRKREKKKKNEKNPFYIKEDA